MNKLLTDQLPEVDDREEVHCLGTDSVVQKTSDKAALFVINSEEVWFPKSQLYTDGVHIYASRWIMDQKGLTDEQAEETY